MCVLKTGFLFVASEFGNQWVVLWCLYRYASAVTIFTIKMEIVFFLELNENQINDSG